MKSSYTTETHPDLDFELQRLREQALLAWPKELAVLRRLVPSNVRSVLEVGSGPGFVTPELLRAFPEATLTCVDMDPDLLAMARARLHDDSRVDFVEGDVTTAPLPAASFDVAFVRMVLQHVPDPGAVLTSLRAAMAPRGRLVVIDSDDRAWGFTDPTIDGLDPVLARRAVLQRRLGGNREIVGALPALMTAAGFTQLTFDAVAVSSAELGLDPFATQLDVSRLALMVHEGLVSEMELAALARARDTFMAGQDPFVVLLMFVLSGVA